MNNKAPKKNNQSSRTKTQKNFPVEDSKQDQRQAQKRPAMTFIVRELSPTTTVKNTSLQTG